MPRLPAFLFYGGDWLSDQKVRRCTFEERGVLVDLLCYMNDADQPGILPWPRKEIVRVMGCKPASLARLINLGVIKGADPGELCEPLIYTPTSGRQKGPSVTLIPVQPGPIWYSARMVRDAYKRLHKGESTRFKPKDPDPGEEEEPSPCQRQGERQGDGSSVSVSVSNLDSLLRSESERVPPDPLGIFCELPCQGGKTYFVTNGMLQTWSETYPGIDCQQEARKMKLWLENNPTRQKTHGGMGRFICNWLSQSAPAGKGNQPGADLASQYLSDNPAFFGGEDVAS